MNTPLDLVVTWADTARQATSNRDDAIRAAHAEGRSLRDIAAAAGLSHTGVKKIIDRQ